MRLLVVSLFVLGLAISEAWGQCPPGRVCPVYRGAGQPVTYSATDASGKVWTHNDPVWLGRWVEKCDAALRLPKTPVATPAAKPADPAANFGVSMGALKAEAASTRGHFETNDPQFGSKLLDADDERPLPNDPAKAPATPPAFNSGCLVILGAAFALVLFGRRKGSR